MDLHRFYIGECFDAYHYFGAHPTNTGWIFRVYAPNAKAVEVIGEFNDWHGTPMQRVDGGGIYEMTIDNALEGQLYKYHILGADERWLDRCDPYGFEMELRPGSASRLLDLDSYKFNDEAWHHIQNQHYDDPLNIYELHLGSFKRHGDGRFYSYLETAQELIPYLIENGFTHVEILPLSEHPCDESWGYQTSGFYSATSRYGSPKELQIFVDLLHQAGIGVILDVVIVHFCVDDYALCLFDGTSLYEYDNHDTGYSEWGSYNFNFYRQDVCSFMQSAMAFWLDKYHIDGLRMDAIANAIYWQGNANRGVNEGVVQFIQKMNQGLHERFSHAILIAEDSTNFLKVTAPVAYDGLGFDYKWDMGWMNDTLKFFMLEPQERAKQMNLLTFSMHYFYNELYLLPLSHDEVVHGKKTVVDKMPGNYDEKFANARLLYLYMMTHPGKKLNFMGNEIGMFREWDEKRELDWNLLEYPKHQGFARFFRDLAMIYRYYPCLYCHEYHSQYYQQHFLDQGTFIYERKGDKDSMIIALNVSNSAYSLLYTGEKEGIAIMDTQWDIYGDTKNSDVKETLSSQTVLTLPPLSGKVFLMKGRNSLEKTNTPLFVKTW